MASHKRPEDQRVVTDREIIDEADRNEDPITGAPGSHPVGAGLGAAGAGAAGAAIGMVAGPVGGVVGAIVGAVAGGLAGKGIAESINPTVEEQYWRANYRDRPYVGEADEYERYHPAYEHGWLSRGKFEYESFDDAEPHLRRDWESDKSRSMKWEDAKQPARDAWERIKHPSRETTESSADVETDVRRAPR